MHLRKFRLPTWLMLLSFFVMPCGAQEAAAWEKQVTGTVGRVLAVVPERDTIYLTVLVSRQLAQHLIFMKGISVLASVMASVK